LRRCWRGCGNTGCCATTRTQSTTHPLIRAYYFTLLSAGEAANATHESIKDYYLDVAGDTPTYPTMDDLAPLIEVVYHACRAGAYDEAWNVYWERISQRDRFVIVHQLAAYETALMLMHQFFPGGDTSQEPQVSKASDKSWILNAVGLRLMSLGRLGEAVPFYERTVEGILEREDWHNTPTALGQRFALTTLPTASAAMINPLTG
jgi:hypothetical protein